MTLLVTVVTRDITRVSYWLVFLPLAITNVNRILFSCRSGVFLLIFFVPFLPISILFLLLPNLLRGLSILGMLKI